MFVLGDPLQFISTMCGIDLVQTPKLFVNLIFVSTYLVINMGLFISLIEVMVIKDKQQSFPYLLMAVIMLPVSVN